MALHFSSFEICVGMIVGRGRIRDIGILNIEPRAAANIEYWPAAAAGRRILNIEQPVFLRLLLFVFPGFDHGSWGMPLGRRSPGAICSNIQMHV